MKEISIKKYNSIEEMEQDTQSEHLKLSFEDRWNLTFELIDMWCDLRNIPQNERKIDRSRFQIIPAPWVK